MGLLSSVTNAVDNLEAMVIDDQIAMAENNKHVKKLIQRQFDQAIKEAGKLASHPPGGPGENGWIEEIEAALGRAKRLLKRVVGKKTRAEIEAKIKEIADKARIKPEDIPERDYNGEP